MHQPPDQILHQVLDGRRLRDVEVQTAHFAIALPQPAQQEPPQHVICADQGEGIVEKLRQHNEVDPHIVLPRTVHLMGGVLVQKQQLTGAKGHRRATLNVMDRLSRAHIHDLHIVVGMHGKRCKPGMRPDRDQFPFGQQFFAVDQKRAA